MRARAAIAGAFVVLLAADLASAADRVVSVAKLRIQRSSTGVEKLDFVSRDAALLFPAVGSADDPAGGTPGGMLVELFSDSSPGGVAFVAPRDGAAPGWAPGLSFHRFEHVPAPDGVSVLRRVKMKSRSLRISGRRAGLALLGDEGEVVIRITTGATRNCALLSGGTIVRDEPGEFFARKAPAGALADCSDASIAGLFPGPCGDGVRNQGEECDGDANGCAPLLSCGEPGFSNECRCCTPDGSDFPQASGGCCNPDSSFLSGGPAGGGFCIPLGCEAPFGCGSGSECLPDQTCCANAGTQWCASTLFPSLEMQPCCAGLECRAPGLFGLVCCDPGGGDCGSDEECCTGHCDGGTCASCVAAGESCLTDAECCSYSCGVSGTCDACAPAGAECVADDDCCDGVCDPTLLTCTAP
jgi:hypothetical protein